ncbi:hypothetical protein B0T22DRAFT_114601 [Podospora appendiculata]|uniref:Nephrocystin 3-like N-terminal domain-containing protein n=1 Tax=Podospora appendiculata TaxID=314037 RepID=A0AAE0XLJ0_9PEZI|nr:hypothetical protein B0T22DRAFT_114601 [Podospora appendiculata]
MQPAGSHRGIIRELDFDEPASLDKLHFFCRLRNKLSTPVSCFSELYETDYGRRFGINGLAKGMVVEEESACIPGLDRCALQADHLKINKYSSPTDRSFLIVSGKISEMCVNAKNIIQRRQHPNLIITSSSHALEKKPEAKACLRDLFVTDPSEDKSGLKRKKGDCAHGTCEWILGTEELTTWLASGSSENPQSQSSHVLWLYGNPGMGKSTMAIFLAEELSKTFSATDGNTLAYFFCDSGFDNRKTATSIVRGLLLQLVQQHPQLLDYLLPKYNDRGAKVFESFDALWSIFMAAAGDEKTGRKYCIIDALDECDIESQKTLLHQFKETFLAPNTTSNIRILVASRPYPEIREYLQRFTNMDLASFPGVKKDIGRCIEERVADLTEKKHYTDKVKTQISEILKDKAEGTFLWVGLAAAELKDVPSKDAVQVLQNMPRGLHSLYKRLLDTAVEKQGPGSDVIQRILSFVVVCLRPLSLLELSEACRLHQDEEDMETRAQFTRDYIESCRLIVIIQDEKVLLLHQSVKDYLVGAGAGFFIDKLKAHADLAYRSVDALIEQSRGGKQSYAHFSNYADLYWAAHAHKAESKFETKDGQAEFFEVDSPCREQWLGRLRSQRWTINGYRVLPRRFSILHVAALWGVPALVHDVIDVNHRRRDTEEPTSYIDPNCLDEDGVTPLEQAARAESPNVFSILLDLGCNATTMTVKAAAEKNRNGKELMTLLLDRRGDQITVTEEVVKAAAGNDGNGKEVMALLLDRRGDQIPVTEEVVKAAAGNYWNGEEVMALLLDRRGDQIPVTEEVVKAAAGNSGNGEEVMALLLDRRGDQIPVTEEVVKAAAGNNENGKEMMALLLDREGTRSPSPRRW